MSTLLNREVPMQRYQLFCQNGRLIVTSRGEDGIANTTDDIWSNR